MINDKKGIMLKFLGGIILALIVFGFASAKVAQIFSTATQAKANYADFVNGLTELSRSEKYDYNDTAFLILDQKTAVVYFEAKSDFVTVEADYDFDQYFARFLRPSNCKDKDKSCLCLFRSYKLDEEDKSLTSIDDADKTAILADSAICESFDFNLKIKPLDPEDDNTCGVGKRNSARLNFYSCQGGFILDRLIMKDVKEEVTTAISHDLYFELQRRTQFNLIKQGNTITLEG